ncbi:FMN reductase [Salipiger aestuarii]|uniref:Flavin reductase n=1 Tax=Salipiger aestuarii TaxID=568098 RepID=A0A327Y0K4_9RHOB|nr:flavin reductase [Salipiger aestuarii]KAA8606439.1 FMN reductase [Salipiger aestuarii]KAB2541070.1 FMN reductase [Salipiger aestuarii]RAK13225.1 flavin reductase [Salipiger aestuarii]
MTDTASPETSDRVTVSQALFRDGMARLAGAVNIVTTDGPGGKAGLTASAVCSVTDTPPTLLVCVNRSTSAAPAFLENDAVCINTVGPAHQDLAMIFGGKKPMAERFAAADFSTGASGAPVLRDAAVSFDCLVSQRAVVGTHEVIFCEVVEMTQAADATGLAYFARKFHELGD